MIDAKPFLFYIETEARAIEASYFIEPARARSWEWTSLREGKITTQLLKIEKEKSEKSVWIAKSISEKRNFPSLRIEIRSPFHNVDLVFKSVRCRSIEKPMSDADIFEDLFFEFETVDYQYVKIEAGVVVGHSEAEMKVRL